MTGRATHRHTGVPGVPEHEGPQHRLRLDTSLFAGRDELPPWLVGHAEGALVVALVRHAIRLPGGTTTRLNSRPVCVPRWYHLRYHEGSTGGV